MKVRYAIEKEIEIPDNVKDIEIQKIIEKKCKEEKGLNYLWAVEKELKNNGMQGLIQSLFDEEC